MFIRNYFKMNKAGDEGTETGSGNSSSTENETDTTETETNETENNDLSKLKAEYDSRIEALDAKNKQILGKLKERDERILKYETAKSDLEKETAEKDGNFEKLLELTKNELETLKSQVQERDDKETERREQLLKDAKIAEFKKQIDSEFFNEADALKNVEFDKFVMESDDDGNPIGFNKQGIKEALDSFRENYSYHIKSKDGSMPGDNAKGSETNGDEGLTENERIQKYILDVQDE